MKIAGPVSLYEIIIPAGVANPKHIYAFGDIHTKETTCSKTTKDITTFITETINANTDKVIDLYVEVACKEPWKTDKSYLEDMGRVFSDCYLQLSPGCPFKNARFHYVDIRQGESESFKQLSMLYTELKQLIHDKRSGKVLLATLHRYEKSNQQVSTFLQPNKDLLSERLLKKEQLKSNMTDKIISYFRKCIDPSIHKMHELKSKLESSANLNDWNDFTMNLLNILSCYVDIYTLLRIFRSFRTVAGKISTDPENIILYMGNTHINRIVDFLEKVAGGEIVFENTSDEEDDFQCLDITGIKLPLFSDVKPVIKVFGSPKKAEVKPGKLIETYSLKTKSPKHSPVKNLMTTIEMEDDDMYN